MPDANTGGVVLPMGVEDLDHLKGRIATAARFGRRYTPQTTAEYLRAPKHLQDRMTWPAHVIDLIRRSP